EGAGPDDHQLPGQDLAGQVGDVGVGDVLGDGDGDRVAGGGEVVEGVLGTADGGDAVAPEGLVAVGGEHVLDVRVDTCCVGEAGRHGVRPYKPPVTLGRVSPSPPDPAAQPDPASTAPHPADPVVAELSHVHGIDPVPGARLADLTTLRIGGRPRALLECATADAVDAAVRALDAADVPVLVLGGGSNLVVAGDDLDLVVVAVRNREIDYLTGAADDRLIVR